MYTGVLVDEVDDDGSGGMDRTCDTGVAINLLVGVESNHDRTD